MPRKRKLSGTADGASAVKKSKESKEKQTTHTNAKSSGTKRKTSASSSKKEQTSKKSYPKLIDEDSNFETREIIFTEPIPIKSAKGELCFPDQPEFRPNLTPKEVLQLGSFGGTYFRPIHSTITEGHHSGYWQELPRDWFEGLNIKKKVTSASYNVGVNTYGVKCGGSLQMWEESGWIHKQDPYGWFQWYCRFYQGRRSSDDERQIGRWLRCAGLTGRWRNNLIAKCVRSRSDYDNKAVSPVVRQTLQHWGYRLSKEDFETGLKKMKKKGQA